MKNEINVVIGSWGSYNECNNRALGSKWLNLSDYTEWEEIEEELKKEGFKLKGIDEELFIQDIEGINDNYVNWDYVNPQNLFETLQDSGVLYDDYKMETMQAYLEINTFKDFEDLVESHGENWDDDIHLFQNYDWEEYGRMIFEEYGYQIPDSIEQFIDYEAYGKYMGDYNTHEYSNGLIEIL